MKYIHLVRWLNSPGGGGDFTQHRPSTNKREAVASAKRLKDVALVAAQKVFNIETGEVLWMSSGWKDEYEKEASDAPAQ